MQIHATKMHNYDLFIKIYMFFGALRLSDMFCPDKQHLAPAVYSSSLTPSRASFILISSFLASQYVAMQTNT